MKISLRIHNNVSKGEKHCILMSLKCYFSFSNCWIWIFKFGNVKKKIVSFCSTTFDATQLQQLLRLSERSAIQSKISKLKSSGRFRPNPGMIQTGLLRRWPVD